MEVIKNGLDCIIIPEVHKRTLVWLHGLGDTAQAFCDDFFQYPLIPDCKVVLPTAAVRPITRYNGELRHAWYDSDGQFTYKPSIEPSVERITSILREESKYTDCLLIGGFSQGAWLSLYTGLSRYEGVVQGIIALSGVVLPMSIPEDRKRIPVLIYHGANDTGLPLDFVKNACNEVLSGVNLTFEVHPTMGHEVYGEEYEFIKKWVSENILN